MELNTLLFYGGLILMGGAAIGAVATFVPLTVSRKRLNAQLEKEYGPQHRRK